MFCKIMWMFVIDYKGVWKEKGAYFCGKVQPIDPYIRSICGLCPHLHINYETHFELLWPTEENR